MAMAKRNHAILISIILYGVVAVFPARPHATPAQQDSALDAQIRAIVNRSEFKHANFGVEIYSLDENRVVYALHGEEFFTPGSTTKLLTEGTGLGLLGAEYRFHTRVFHTGSIEPGGTVKGDLILVASGDPNLSGRIQSDGKTCVRKR